MPGSAGPFLLALILAFDSVSEAAVRRTDSGSGTPPLVVGTPFLVAVTPPLVVGTPFLAGGTPPLVVRTLPLVAGTLPPVVGTLPLVVGTCFLVGGRPPLVVGTLPIVVGTAAGAAVRSPRDASRRLSLKGSGPGPGMTVLPVRWRDRDDGIPPNWQFCRAHRIH